MFMNIQIIVNILIFSSYSSINLYEKGSNIDKLYSFEISLYI